MNATVNGDDGDDMSKSIVWRGQMWRRDDKSKSSTDHKSQSSSTDHKSQSILSRSQQVSRGGKGVSEEANGDMGIEGRGEGGEGGQFKREGGQVKRVGGEGGDRVERMGEMSRTPPTPERDLPSPEGANEGGRDKYEDEVVTHIEPYDLRRRPREVCGCWCVGVGVGVWLRRA